MPRVGIIGIGHGQFGRRSDATVQELAFEAFREAVQDAGIDPKDIDGSVIGSVPEYHKQRSLPGVVQEYLSQNPGISGPEVIQAFGVARSMLPSSISGAAARARILIAISVGLVLLGLLAFLFVARPG